MTNDKIRSYISNLPVGPVQAELLTQGVAPVTAVDINNLPTGIVTGSNLIEFPKAASAAIKSSVALSLLAAQRVAQNDHVINSPDQWIDRHNTVLENLNWLVEQGALVHSELSGVNVAVHKAIIPFLTAAFGGAVAAGSLILTALNNLQSMNQNDPFITLFDHQSRRFDVTEYMFTVVEVDGDQVRMKMASARFSASFGSTQVLFFKVNQQHAKFDSASASLSAQADLLEELNADLKTKLANSTKSFIKSLPDNLLV